MLAFGFLPVSNEKREWWRFIPLQVNFHTMHDFSIRVKAKCGCDTFKFNKIFIPGGIRFHVSVSLRENNLYFFNMELQKDKWVICSSPLPPDCIKKLEESLSQAIMNNLENKNGLPD